MSAPGEEGAPPSARETAAALQRQIEAIRDDLAGMVGELDRRRHALFDVRRHPLPLVAVGAALAALAGGGIALAVVRRRRRARLGARLERLQQALARMIDKPQRVAVVPGAGRKVAGAAGAAVASVLAKRLAGRLLGAGRRGG
ncbi:MAG TPA: hypothetical protein VHO06_04050 [Polyangia bacterium]|nr:hypothetical protein [Polyangia bacterium]